MIPYGKQEITQQDIDTVVSVLKSDFLTQGPQVPLFESSLATTVEAKFAVAFNSATSALHLSCLALGVKQGDLVWTSPISFVASANCALYCGATVDFVDINRLTYNICVSMLAEKLERRKAQSLAIPKVLVVVHMAGQSCEMEEIHSLSKIYGFSVIEDASHCIGGKYKGQPIGSCKYSDITVFSFHPVKIITTAEGGIATTNNPTLAKEMALLRSHGITREEGLMTCELEGPWYYQQLKLGYNYRMTEIQAALGISQLGKLEQFIETRHFLANRYNELLSNMPLICPWQHPDSYSGMHLYIIRLKLDQINTTRKNIFQKLRNLGIGVNVHYIPIHTQPYYQKLGFKKGMYIESETYYDEAISIPLYQGMSTSEQDIVVRALKEVFGEHSNNSC